VEERILWGSIFTDIIDKIVQESNQLHLTIDLNRHFGTETDLLNSKERETKRNIHIAHEGAWYNISNSNIFFLLLAYQSIIYFFSSSVQLRTRPTNCNLFLSDKKEVPHSLIQREKGLRFS